MKILTDTITRFPETKEDKLGRTNRYQHKIDTGDALPFQKRYYPVSPYVQAEIDKELDRMLRLDVIEPASSPWANPLVCVPKNSGKLRLCLDARRLNTVTVKESYPLPYITRILGRLKGTRYLSSIDLSDAFWQIPLEESSKPKTAFVIPGRGLFQFKVMPFGLCNAAQSLCRLMDEVLGYDLEPAVFVYLDDIIIATNSFDEHVQMLQTVADRLRSAGLTINIEKSKFGVKSLKYLGFILDRDGLHTDPEKLKAIVEFPTPGSVKEVRRFLGMSGWYRRFICNFATISSPLTDLLKKGSKKFHWTVEAEEAFVELKRLLTTSPILSNPDYEKQFTIQCDASDLGVGAILSQGEGDEENIIAFMSQKLTSTQQKYSTTEKECLAVILAVEKFRAYVEGVKFKIVTDHSSLQWLQSMQNPSGRLFRWTMRLQPFHFEIVHKKGKLNVVPDTLSRAVVDAFELCIVDDWYQCMWDKIVAQENHYPDYKISEGKIYKLCKLTNKLGLVDSQWRLVLPKDDRLQILNECHNDPLAAHLGYHKTYNRISAQYYWPNMSKDVRGYVQNCDTCKASKPPNLGSNPPMGQQKDADSPWELISMDYLGPYPRTKEGNTVILVIVDWFSKFVIAKAMRSADAKSLVTFLERNVFLLFGVPNTVWSDNGKQLVSKQMSDLLTKYKINHVRTPLYSPQSNHSERVNKVLTSSIRAYVKGDQRDWDKYLPQIMCAINTATHESTRYTPYFVNFGKEMRLSGVSKLGSIGDDQNKRALDWESERKIIHEEVRNNIENAYNRARKYYNLRTRAIVFKPGEIAWRRNFQLSDASKGIAAKLLPKHVKCRILSCNGNVYEVEDVDSKKIGKYHARDLLKD